MILRLPTVGQSVTATSGLLIGLVDWARTLGLRVIAGGKACDGEYLHDPARRTLNRPTRQHDYRVALDDATAPAFDPIPPRPAGSIVATRRHVARELPGLGGWDLGEMAIAANATGLLPDVPELHAPIVRVAEIPAVLCTRDDGGILARAGAIDAVICLRPPREAGLGGGVFVVVDCVSDYSRRIMVGKGLLANRRGNAALIYRPYHLCGVEPRSACCGRACWGRRPVPASCCRRSTWSPAPAST